SRRQRVPALGQRAEHVAGWAGRVVVRERNVRVRGSQRLFAMKRAARDEQEEAVLAIANDLEHAEESAIGPDRLAEIGAPLHSEDERASEDEREDDVADQGPALEAPRVDADPREA